MKPNFIFHAADTSVYAIEATEDQKYAQYENSCAQQGNLFVPLAITILFGRGLRKSPNCICRC